MPDHVYKSIELTGSSSAGIEDAVNYWQVTMKVGFTVD